MSRCWIYHENESPKIVNSRDAERYYKQGWADSPMRFLKVTDCGVDPDDAMAVQMVGDSVQGVTDRLNAELNLKSMRKSELVKYANDHHGIKLDMKLKKPDLLNTVQELANGNGA